MLRFAGCFCLLIALGIARGQEFDESYRAWPEDLTLNGKVLIDHGLKDFDAAAEYLRRICRDKNVVVFRATDSAHDDSVVLRGLRQQELDAADVSVVESPRLPMARLRESLRTADVVGIEVSKASSIEGQPDLSKDLQRFVDRGGILIANSVGAECLGKVKVADWQADEDALRSNINPGFGLLPDCLIACVSKSDRMKADDVLPILERQTPVVGLLVEPDTLLVLSGRKLFSFGTGTTRFCLPGCEHLAARVESLSPLRSRSRARPAWESLVDLTEWRRDAIERTLERFPPEKPRTPEVTKGTLLIVGGGGIPRGLMDRFVELAGGTEDARLVFVPCSESDHVGERHWMVRQWKAMGVKHATFIHTKDRRRADQDESFLEPLKNATGIWFGGGRQWNFADSYYGTTAHKLMKEVVRRGGVVGGSSAGASIQARYLARATPIGNTRIMAPGYERGGLGFISGVAIDQHFTQRGRQRDMTRLISRYPQLLGIGIDETTAIEVQGSKATVSGRGRVFFYDRARAVGPGEPDYVALPAGSVYDLAKRAVIRNAGESETQ